MEIKGTTRHGFEYEFDSENVDMECIDLIGEMTENPTVTGKILMLMLGRDQKKRLYDFLRDEKGHVPPEKTMEAFLDIMRSNNESKNS